MSAEIKEGCVKFHVSVKVDMAEMAHWEPARVVAFFDGIAAVLAARNADSAPGESPPALPLPQRGHAG